MADISIINKDNTNYNVKDAVGREALAVVENKGAKNILKLGFTHKSAGTQTADMTADGNGIIVNGDRNTSSDVILVYDLSTNASAMSDTRYTIPEGKYVIAPTGTSSLRIQVYCHDGGGVNSERLGQASTAAVGFEYTSALKAQYPYIAYRLWASRVSSFSNLTVYPMVCSKAEWDISQAYVPYGKTNAELTTLEQQDRDGLATAINKGAKNVADMSKSSFTTNEKDGVTVTLSGNTITSSGTSGTSINQFHRILYNGDDLLIPPGTWIAALIGTGTDAFRIEVFATGYEDLVKGTYGSTVEFTIPDNATTSYLRITQKPSTNCTGTFKLLITTKAEWDISQAYVPYGKTNAELTNDTSTLFTENTRQETEIGVVANAGAKNLLNVKLAENYRAGQEGSFPITIGNVTFSENGGIITTSGTASATLTLRAPIYLPIGTYYISGSPASGSDTTYRTDLREQGTNVMISSNRDYGSGFEAEIKTARTVDWCIRIQSGFDTTELTFSPMIRSAAITDPTFQPYAKTNRELTVLTDEDRSALVEIVDGGAKNLLKNTLGSGTKSRIEYTTGTDGSIVITAGTARDGNADFVIPFTLKESGQYVLQGCPSGGSGTTYKGQITLYPSMANVVEIFDNTSVTATLTGGTQYAYRFRVYSGKAIGDVTIYPMVCSLAAWKISTTYQPYRLTIDEKKNNQPTVIVATSSSRADLNTYVYDGTYVSRSSSTSQYIDNCPVSDAGFVLNVYDLSIGTGTTCIQEIIDTSANSNRIYTRRKTTSGWTVWCVITGNPVVSA